MKTNLSWLSRGRPAKIVGMLLAVTLAVVFVSVAVAGSLGRVVVESTPSGASVIVGSHTIGQTPVSLQLPADGQKVRIRVKKRGYITKSLSVRPKSGKTTRVKIKLQRK